MAPRSLLVTLLALVLLAVGTGLWFLLGGGEARGSVETGSTSPTRPVVAPSDAESLQVTGPDARDVAGRFDFEAPGGIEIDAGVRVPGNGWVEGRVIARDGAEPLVGMRVELFALPPAGAALMGRVASLFDEAKTYVGTGEPLATTGTDAAGEFRFEGVRPGTWYVQARGAYHVPETFAKVRVMASGQGGPVDVFVRAGGRIVGVVLLSDGTPAAGADITLMPSVTTLLESLRSGDLCLLQTTSDQAGNFVLAGVPPGPAYDVYAEGSEFALSYELDVPVRAGEDTRVVLQARRGGSIGGRVVSSASNDPIAGAYVAAVPHGMRYLPFAPSLLAATRTRTDARGEYTLKNVPPGEIDVVGIALGHTADIGPTVFVPEGASVSAPDFELLAGPTITGRVVDAAGNPLAGVSVTWDPLGFEEQGFEGSIAPLVASAVKVADLPDTGPDGRFEAGAFPGEPPYELNFQKAGYARLTHEWTPALPGPDEEPEELEIVMGEGGFVQGIVMDAEASEPVPSFTVGSDELFGTDGPPLLGPFGSGVLVESDQGNFRIGPLEPGTVEIEVDAPGYLKAVVSDLEVAAGETTRGVIVLLKPGGIVRGVVQDEEGRPIAGSIVFPRYEGPGDGVEESGRSRRSRRGEDTPKGLAAYITQLGVIGTSSNVTDSGGNFELSGVEAGSQVIGAVHRDFATGWSAPVTVQADEPARTQVVLTQGGAIFGRVVDRFDRPIPKTMVIAASPGNMDNRSAKGEALYQGRTDEEGHYRIEHVAAGTYFLVLTRGDEALDPMSFLGSLDFDLVTVPAGEEVEYDIVDDSVGGTRVFGRVTDRGTAVGSGQVTALGFEGDNLLGLEIKVARIKDEGRYEFEGLSPGEYQFQIETGEASGGARMIVDIPDMPEYRLDLFVAEGRIEGRVVDAASGEPIKNARLEAASSEAIQPQGMLAGLFGRETSLLRDRSDEDGVFVFERLQAADYTITVGYAGDGDKRYSPAKPLRVSVATNESVERIELRLEPALELTGHVYDAEGAPLEGARVSAWISGRLDSIERSRSSDAEGRFVIQGLAPGTYTVSASHPDHASARLEGVVLGAGTEDLRMELEAGIHVRVEVLGANGRPVSGASARLVSASGDFDPGDLGRTFEAIFTGDGVSGADGMLDLGHYQPGAYVLEAQRGGSRSERQPVTLEEGGAVTLTARLQ